MRTGMTYQAIANHFGVHHSRVQQIEKRTLDKLRQDPRMQEIYRLYVLKRDIRSNNLGTLYPDELQGEDDEI